MKDCGHSDVPFACVQHAPLTVTQARGHPGRVVRRVLGPGFRSIAPGGHVQILTNHAQDAHPTWELGSQAVTEGKRSHKFKMTLPPDLNLKHKTRHRSVISGKPGFLPGLVLTGAALVGPDEGAGLCLGATWCGEFALSLRPAR